ncbi:topoisomerase DNA-binding C4 zinc finger domain-containing protein, partial [bacterium]|nr:topoisomerase DNA-binding C4 zinc finger domain-containing protein [candidate division CSSED10-310 bacterium]
TYMRTDSPRLSEESLAMVRGHLSEEYGPQYVPERPNVFPAKKNAQGAHEAIRPTDVALTPDVVTTYLSREELALYRLIWNRFLACQMTPHRLLTTTINVTANTMEFQVKGSRTTFPGFTRVYSESGDEATDQESKDGDVLPAVTKGDVLELLNAESQQNFTKPPARYSEASLVKDLEESGIGRPSTYAAILQIIRNRNYATVEDRRFKPTELGILVVDMLVEGFPTLMSVEFTAQLEEELDEIEDGRLKWIESVASFYASLEQALIKATDALPNIKQQVQETDITCDKCGAGMVIKWGARGKFLACSAFPTCKNTMEYRQDENGKVEPIQPETTDRACPLCNAPLIERQGRYGRFLACSRYPECNHSQPFPIGISCPEPACPGEIVELHGRRRRLFYGCSRYPDCQLRLWQKPVAETCPQCGYGVLVRSRNKKGEHLLSCPRKECRYTRMVEDDQDT